MSVLASVYLVGCVMAALTLEWLDVIGAIDKICELFTDSPHQPAPKWLVKLGLIVCWPVVVGLLLGLGRRK